MEGSRSHPRVSSSVEVTTHPTNLLLPPARAQRYLRSADPAAQGFHRPLQNMLWGQGGWDMRLPVPVAQGSACQPPQGAAEYSTLGRTDPHPTQRRGGVGVGRVRIDACQARPQKCWSTRPQPHSLFLISPCTPSLHQPPNMPNPKWQDGCCLCHLWVLLTPGA